jgi:NodT family efflux transporter outer membrane factor (OMF) lipoprotein
VRNTIREEQYNAQLSAADLENERLTEQATLAEVFFELRGQDALTNLYQATVDADRKAYEIAKSGYDTGVSDEITAVEAQNTLQNAESALTNLGVARAQYEHAIAVLIGTNPSNFKIAPKGLTTAPPAIPIGLPSQLLERRPDIAGAERSMAAANAQIGVAVAAFYPNLTLSAEGGLESSTLKHLFDWPSRFWSVGPSVSETIFDAGLRRATVNQYVATYNADVAAYRQTVLTAFQQVEDYLAQVRILSKQIQQQQAAVESAKKYVALETGRYDTGIDPYVDLVTAQTTLLTDQQSLASLQIEQMTASVELIEALGGGWDSSQLPTPEQVSKKIGKSEIAIEK